MAFQNLISTLAGKSGYGGHPGNEAAQLSDLLVIIRYALGMSLDPRQLNLRNSLGFTMTPVQTRDGVREGVERVDAAQSAVKSRTPRTVGYAWPTAAAHLGPALGILKKGKCRGCDAVGHDYFECPKHFFDMYNQAMPGYDRDGAKVPNYWHEGQDSNGPSKAIASAWVQHAWRQDAEIDGPEHIVEVWRRCAARPQ